MKAFIRWVVVAALAAIPAFILDIIAAALLGSALYKLFGPDITPDTVSAADGALYMMLITMIAVLSAPLWWVLCYRLLSKRIPRPQAI